MAAHQKWLQTGGGKVAFFSGVITFRGEYCMFWKGAGGGKGGICRNRSCEAALDNWIIGQGYVIAWHCTISLHYMHTSPWS